MWNIYLYIGDEPLPQDFGKLTPLASRSRLSRLQALLASPENTGPLQAALLSPRLILDPFQIQVAAVHVMQRLQSAGKLVTRTRHSELLYALSPSNNMIECFAQTGFKPTRDAAALLVCIEPLSRPATSPSLDSSDPPTSLPAPQPPALFGNLYCRPLESSECRSCASASTSAGDGNDSVHAALDAWLASSEAQLQSPAASGTRVRIRSAPAERLAQLIRDEDLRAVYRLDELLTCTCSKLWPCAHSSRDRDSLLSHVLLRISAKPIL